MLRIASGAERLRIWLLQQQWFSSKLLPALPRELRWLLRTVYLKPVDLVDRWRGPNRPITPPRAHNYSGAAIDFEGGGAALVGALREVAGLTPSSRVLDVGCGLGRLGAALAGYLDADGSYDGLDIVPDGIKWCSENITGPHGNVHFTLSDVRNDEYNPHGKVEAVDYRFPFADETFDLIVLVSVFTHMLPTEWDHYLGEIARVLKVGGRCFATYYLLTEQSRRLMKDSPVNFKYDYGSHAVLSEKMPELSVGYDEDFIEGIYARHGLPTERHLGYWCGQPSRWSPESKTGEQDVLVGLKVAQVPGGAQAAVPHVRSVSA